MTLTSKTYPRLRTGICILRTETRRTRGTVHPWTITRESSRKLPSMAKIGTTRTCKTQMTGTNSARTTMISSGTIGTAVTSERIGMISERIATINNAKSKTSGWSN